ncbi:MAG: HAD-IA family hydrolase [Candidatus Eremiobacteraeota bacterium]|nr:HAD-IA family hydrolase [Candidatus Eremiobacteraeota bacterium]
MPGEYDVVLFDLFGTLVDGSGKAVDGAREMLLSLPADRWGIVTSCCRRTAEELVRQAGLLQPRILIAAEDVASGKPAPDCYENAASALGVSPGRCLVIEDSAPGANAARAAGMDVIEVGSRRALRDVLMEVHEDATITATIRPRLS